MRIEPVVGRISRNDGYARTARDRITDSEAEAAIRFVQALRRVMQVRKMGDLQDAPPHNEKWPPAGSLNEWIRRKRF
jgi:hypothetical protein